MTALPYPAPIEASRNGCQTIFPTPVPASPAAPPARTRSRWSGPPTAAPSSPSASPSPCPSWTSSKSTRTTGAPDPDLPARRTGSHYFLCFFYTSVGLPAPVGSPVRVAAQRMTPTGMLAGLSLCFPKPPRADGLDPGPSLPKLLRRRLPPGHFRIFKEHARQAYV